MIDLELACSEIRDRHLDIVKELIKGERHQTDASDNISSLCSKLQEFVSSIAVLNECTDQSRDLIASFGERLSTVLFHHALLSLSVDSELVDARLFMRTNGVFSNAIVDFNSTTSLCEEYLAPLLNDHAVVVTQGFLGSTKSGNTTTLGRGGSDTSAAILGAVMNATEIKIWTDVSGVFSADPRSVPRALPVPSLSFGEVRELAQYGANVLHPETIAPAIRSGIPVHVLNTFRPQDPGTIITADAEAHGDLHAVSVVRNCVLITGSNNEVQQAVRSGNFLNRILLDVTSVENAMVVVAAESNTEKTNAEVAVAGSDLKTSPVALAVITGPEARTPATMERIGHAVKGLPVHAIVSGTSAWATFVIVPSEHANSVVGELHRLVH